MGGGSSGPSLAPPTRCALVLIVFAPRDAPSPGPAWPARRARSPRCPRARSRAQSRRGLGAHEVREQAIGAGHAGRQLAEEHEPGVHEYTAPDPGMDQAAAEVLLARIVAGEHRLVPGVE